MTVRCWFCGIREEAREAQRYGWTLQASLPGGSGNESACPECTRIYLRMGALGRPVLKPAEEPECAIEEVK